MQDTNRRHTVRLKQIVKEYGWPTAALVGTDGAAAAFTLVQHADDKTFQKQCLTLMEKAFKKQELPGQYVAALTDFIRIIERKKQVYGTQFSVQKDGSLKPYPIEDEKNVDQRRAELDLPTLDEQMSQLKDSYKPGKK